MRSSAEYLPVAPPPYPNLAVQLVYVHRHVDVNVHCALLPLVLVGSNAMCPRTRDVLRNSR
ncbi:hypothetical protein OBBRIDRAFT_794869 [Obba rivulosa]|uniref:Uncharacterized protein n=1 Tax=Obba rivulosa TaxID=1052685 RepID=A0A8E2B0D5_9APHY|nr:hypothetical protein OBBRIDRAFT_794869 [Obba rivulosa]